MKQLGPIVAALLAGAALIWVVATTMPEDAAPQQTPDAETDTAPKTAEPGATPQAQHPAAQVPTKPGEPSEPGAPVAQDEPQAANERPAIPLPPRSVSSLLDPRIEKFESEPRDPKAPEYEEYIASFFDSDDVPPELLESVLCRATICRVRMRWTTERAEGMLSASMRMFMGPNGTWPSEYLHPDAALDVDPDADPSGVVIIDLYARRKTAAEAEEARRQAAAAKAQLEHVKPAVAAEQAE